MVFKVYLDASQFSEMYMLERLLFIYLWMHPETWEPQPCIFVFRPTPSWLSPGRSTSLYLPENELVIRMHVRQRRRASKEGDCGPVHSPMSTPRPHEQKHETKSKTKTKQEWEPQPCRLCLTLLVHFPHKTNLGRFGTTESHTAAHENVRQPCCHLGKQFQALKVLQFF